MEEKKMKEKMDKIDLILNMRVGVFLSRLWEIEERKREKDE